MVLAQLLVRIPNPRRIRKRKARPHRVDRRPPIGTPLHRLTQHRQRARLHHLVICKLIGTIGSARCIDRKVILLRALVGIGLDREQRLRKPKPALRRLAVSRGGLRIKPRRTARIARQKLVRSSPEIRRLLGPRLPMVLHIVLVALRVVRDAAVGERLLFRRSQDGWRRRNEQSRNEKRAERAHGARTLTFETSNAKPVSNA